MCHAPAFARWSGVVGATPHGTWRGGLPFDPRPPGPALAPADCSPPARPPRHTALPVRTAGMGTAPVSRCPFRYVDAPPRSHADQNQYIDRWTWLVCWLEGSQQPLYTRQPDPG